jgi:signal transduction histidine kinase
VRNVLNNATATDSLQLLIKVGDQFFEDDLYEQALDAYFNVVKTAQHHQLMEALGDGYNSIGRVYYHLENHALALSYYSKALEVFEQKNDSTSLGGVLNNIGLVMYELDSMKQALQYYFRSLAMEDAARNALEVASIYHNIALVYNFTQKQDSAIVNLNRSLDIFKQMGRQKLVANTYNNIGRAYYKSHHYQQALAYFDSAFTVADSIHAAFLIMDNLRYKADSYLHLEDFGNAYKFMNLYYIQKDSLFSLEKNRQLDEVRTRYESEIKEKENTLLKRKNKTNAEIIRYQYFAGGAVVVIAMLLAVLLIIYYRSYHGKRKAHLQLQAQKEEIEIQNMKLGLLNDEISAQKKDLEALNQVKDKLFSIISHELKSPLNSLKGTLSLIMTNAISVEELKKLSSDISDKINSLSIFLDNLLNWAKSQMEGIEAQPVTIRIKSLVDENLELIRYQAEKKEIDIHADVPESIEAYSDEEMTRLAIRNILTNAIKFTRRGGSVSILASTEDQYTTITISDTGIGMSEDKLTSLFTAYPGVSKGTNNELGTGLGLMLTKSFVEMNNGQIKVESTAGSGTTFRLYLPRVSGT